MRIFTEDGDELIWNSRVSRVYGCSPERAGQLLRNLDPVGKVGNCHVYLLSDVFLSMREIAPSMVGLVNATNIVTRAGTTHDTFSKVISWMPKPVVERPQSDGRVFRWWSPDDADEIVERLLKMKARRTRSND